MLLDPKALRALQREIEAHHDAIEAHHDAIEEPLAKLQAEYAAVCEKAAPLEAEKRRIETAMGELKSPLHEKRQTVAAHRAAEEKANAPAA